VSRSTVYELIGAGDLEVVHVRGPSVSLLTPSTTSSAGSGPTERSPIPLID
jgi:hypothetical protein